MSDGDRKGLGTAAWIAIVVGGLIVVALAAGCVFAMLFGVRLRSQSLSGTSVTAPAGSSAPVSPAPAPAPQPSSR
ncbi:MAG: hypothetical protein IT454_20770 [Planctomycetes bacterium]|nr:hypothetical protein [Planctomycetota bacterium]